MPYRDQKEIPDYLRKQSPERDNDNISLSENLKAILALAVFLGSLLLADYIDKL